MTFFDVSKLTFAWKISLNAEKRDLGRLNNRSLKSTLSLALRTKLS